MFTDVRYSTNQGPKNHYFRLIFWRNYFFSSLTVRRKQATRPTTSVVRNTEFLYHLPLQEGKSQKMDQTDSTWPPLPGSCETTITKFQRNPAKQTLRRHPKKGWVSIRGQLGRTAVASPTAAPCGRRGTKQQGSQRGSTPRESESAESPDISGKSDSMAPLPPK